MVETGRGEYEVIEQVDRYIPPSLPARVFEGQEIFLSGF